MARRATDDEVFGTMHEDGTLAGADRGRDGHAGVRCPFRCPDRLEAAPGRRQWFPGRFQLRMTPAARKSRFLCKASWDWVAWYEHRNAWMVGAASGEHCREVA